MKKKLIGISFGAIAGIIDVIPMVIQKLTWDANLSAFSMWVIIGFFISTIEIKIAPVLKGLMISFMTLLPTAILIGTKEPFTLIPISVMTVILGSLLGFTIENIGKEK